MKKLLSAWLIFASYISFATHNRAGEIRYERIEPYTQVVGGSTVPFFKYLITVIKYTDDDTPAGVNNTIADRCVDTVYFGDGKKLPVDRTNGTTPLCAGCLPCGCPYCGEIILDDPGYRVKLNTYTVTHVYSGAGTYTISTADPNRNDGVYNMLLSGQQEFYLQSILYITNFSGANTSPQLMHAPIDQACMGKCFYHNPEAYDPDGDSLSFKLSTPKGANGQTVIGYAQPGTYPGGTFSINSLDGKLTWCTPTITAQYNLAFIIEEWRKNTSGVPALMGTTLRDMQVIVLECPYNNPPGLLLPSDTCVEAGTLLHKSIQVTDQIVSPPNDPNANRVTLSGNAGAFSGPAPQAVLSNSFAITPYTALFTWQTSCDQVRQQPYLTTFEVQDQGPGIALVNFGTYSIKVVPPSVKNIAILPQNAFMQLTWDPSVCNPANNPLLGYKIYRKEGCSVYTYGPCEPGVNPATGFVSITKNPVPQNNFTDDNGGIGLTVGQDYSYLVVAVYADGALSYAGSPVCARLKRNVPVILNVDVRSTSSSAGSVYIRWAKPLLGINDLDTLLFKGPYRFILKYRSGRSGNYIPIYTASSPYFLDLNTAFLHTGINTQDSATFYKVEFIAGEATVGASNPASSVYLYSAPSDRRINLSWVAATPWTNYKYILYRKDPGASNYIIRDSTTQAYYSDTVHVVNRYTYCYKVLAAGRYSDSTILSPLLNNSQEACATARDLTPPCGQGLWLDENCSSGFLKVNWSTEKTPCSDDVLHRVLLYKETLESNYTVVDTFDNRQSDYNYDGTRPLAGCYAIQVIDSSGNASVVSANVCMDICPEFELPNIFSPNGDRVNDFYKAIKVRQIKEIDLEVFDRWGNLVYKTADPYFQWNGTSLQSNRLVSDETYFYVCKVFEPHITGIRTRQLKGYLQVVR